MQHQVYLSNQYPKTVKIGNFIFGRKMTKSGELLRKIFRKFWKHDLFYREPTCRKNNGSFTKIFLHFVVMMVINFSNFDLIFQQFPLDQGKKYIIFCNFLAIWEKIRHFLSFSDKYVIFCHLLSFSDIIHQIVSCFDIHHI